MIEHNQRDRMVQNSIFPNLCKIRRRALGLPALFCLGLLLGCQSQTTEEKEPPSKVSKKVEDTYAQITKKLDELTTSGKDLSQSTVEEMEKLFVFEYKVLEVPLDAPTKDVETALQNAGKERWECFTAQTITTSLRFFCKRRPESVLRYVPYVPRFLW